MSERIFSTSNKLKTLIGQKMMFLRHSASLPRRQHLPLSNVLRRPSPFMSHSLCRFSTSGAATEPKYEAEMREFAEKTLKMDYYIVEQGIQRAENTYQTGHRAP